MMIIPTKKQYSSSHSQAGFTLVELMVSLSLFIIVVMALIGSLYSVNDASRKVQAMRTVMDNLNFAMEAMSRTIRTSENIVCPGPNTPNCPITSAVGGQTQIAMNSTLGEHRKVEYRYVPKNGTINGKIEKQSTGLDTTGNLIPGDVITWQAITSPEIDIQNMSFFVDGASTTDCKQPSVIIKVDGVATVVGGTTIPFALQTLLSQRTPEQACN